MKRVVGFVRWYDGKSDDGIIQDFKGNEYYFNSWSLPKTVWEVTGTDRKTGKTKTIRTRYYCGMMCGHKTVPDPSCELLRNDMPVEFEQADGISQRWAVKLVFRPDGVPRVLEHHLVNVLESLEHAENDSRPWYRDCWCKYYLKRLDELLEKIIAA